jgi:hypothetical protein
MATLQHTALELELDSTPADDIWQDGEELQLLQPGTPCVRCSSPVKRVHRNGHQHVFWLGL